MTTAKEALNGEGCLARAADDEPVFVLRAQDQAAANTVRDWAVRAKALGSPAEKVIQAFDDARAMDAWRNAHGGGKVPD